MEYGLIGAKLSQSFSKMIHESIMDYTYEPKELSEDELDSFMKKRDFKAINVTIPYKEKVIPYLDELGENAAKIGAVNVIVNKDGKLIGHNSDYDGLRMMIVKYGIEIKNRRVAILGTGGTSKTAYTLVSNLGAKEAMKVSRNKKEGVLVYDELYAYNPEVLINTTPVGMYPEIDGISVDLDRLPNLQSVVDVVANPIRTRLQLEAAERGLKTAGGIYMLVGQAIKAIEHFKDIKLDPNMTDKVYREVISQKQNIALIGMPGCGKSTIAEVLDKNFIDTDALIVEKEQKPITDIFKENGEEYFRRVESEVIKEVSAMQGKVIATGGGAILNKDNIMHLRMNSKIVYLKRDIDLLMTSDSRPLSSNTDDLKKRYEERKDLYEKYADVIIGNNGSVKECVKEIQKYENSGY